MEYPLVTIVCLSYNHSPYLEDALNSIWNLDYPNIQLIVADDASLDDSQTRIKELVKGKDCQLVLNSSNIGHCKTFNNALALAKGEYIIDLAADDILLPHALTTGVQELVKRGEKYGVFYADAEIINKEGKITGKHLTNSFFNKGVVPTGDVYKALLGTYFLNPVTMIYRTAMVKNLGAYDEALDYEDFDFWIRSARDNYYCYQPVITVQRRELEGSASTNQYIKNSRMLPSTLAVCKKALRLNRNKSEDWALLKRIAYEGKMSIASNNYAIGAKFFILSIHVFFKVRL